jgi:disulfide bond formation protein DsbB
MPSLIALATRWAAALIVLASAGSLGSALISQFFFGLQPCVLCIYQRWPYVAAIILGGMAMMASGNPRTRAILLVLCGGVFLTGAGIAAFHVGVEQHWWQGTAECTAQGLNQAKTVEELRALLEKAPVVRCDEVAWSLFGISMAGYNLAVSLFLAAFSLFAARRTGMAQER